MNHTEAVEKILKNLDSWRHLPKYQLERRADMFFGLFVRYIVASHLNIALHSTIIPEFPYKNSARNTTVNFDYLLFSEDLSTAYILELKTDAGSVSDDQLIYLKKVKEENDFCSQMTDILAVAGKSNQGSKYDHLFRILKNIKLMDDNRQTTKSVISVEILFLSPKLDVKSYDKVRAVVDPDGSGERNIISFNRAAYLLENKGGTVECLFASYLKKWEQQPAGSACCE